MFGEDYFEERKRKAQKAEEEAKQKEEEHAAHLAAIKRKRNEIRKKKEKAYQGRLAKVKEDLEEAGFLQAEGNFTKPEHFSHFNTNISRQYIGDRDYAVKFNGEGTKLLFEVKEQMKFRKLGRFKAVRNFTDGTIITATSIYGNDFIKIDVTKSAEKKDTVSNTCRITFIDPPTAIPPMVPGELAEGNEDGQDYWKMYFHYELFDCTTCKEDVEWTFSFNFVTPVGTYIDHYDNEPEDHCVISTDRGCSGELIGTGKDENGTYIIFKVYTEADNYTRSGHGYVRIRAEGQEKKSNLVLCSQTHIAQVKCCERSDLVQPEIYWENWQWANCSGIFFYGGTQLCEVRTLISQNHLFWYAAGESGNAARFYALPEIGGCLPYTWSLNGPGELELSDYDINGIHYGRIIIYHPPEAHLGCEDITISVRDECGGEDYFIASCCQFAEPVMIGYTTLAMAVNEVQDLTAFGGCPPYSWALNGGGGTLVTLNEIGTQARYTAPATNPNCVSNPRITLTDCCGYETTIQIAVNENIVPGAAYRTCTGTTCAPNLHCTVTPCFIWGVFCRYVYQCDNTLFVSGCWNGGGGAPPNCLGAMPALACTAVPSCEPGNYEGWFTPICGGLAGSVCTVPNQPCNTTWDLRTAAQKAAGCCPLNPQTGLPF